jgi:hypothetical protein
MNYQEILVTVRGWPIEEQIRLIDEIYFNLASQSPEWEAKMLQTGWPEMREQFRRAAELSASDL